MPASIAYAALLRAVNVGGTGKLPMTELARLCEREGLCDVKTYIQSGNVVFTSAKKEAAVKAALEKALERHMGKPVAVMVRTEWSRCDAAGSRPALAIASTYFADVPNNVTRSESARSKSAAG